MPRFALVVVAASVLTAAHAAAQPTYTLYDPAVGTLPAAQPWLAYADNAVLTGGTAGQSFVAGQGARLVTDAAVAAGYSNHNPLPPSLKNASFPTLDRAAGFRLSWTLQVAQESHLNANRAGFSVILLGSDRRGVELGFWANEVWAQADNPLFTHAEGAAFNTGPATNYELTILGNAYSLTANGAPLLSGPLRDYSANGIPYTLPNYLFLGDDTSSAAADVTLGQVTLTAPVPEPGAWALAAFGVVVARFARRRGSGAGRAGESSWTDGEG
jgi:hypothetical protein